jgi:hypothetical protein
LELFVPVTIGEEAVVADADEALGENVEKESSKKLYGVESHGAVAMASSVVLVSEAHLAVAGGDEPLVGDRDSMGVAGEVLEDPFGTTEGRLGIDNPVLVLEGVEQGIPCVRVGEVAALPVELETVLLEGVLQVSDELASE